MSKCYSSLKDDFIYTADDEDYRHAYAEESLNISIATQIKVLREQREMSQETLARKADMKQSVISRYENVNYASWSIKSLRRLARVFDVDLEVRFRSFGDLVKSVENFTRKSLEVPKFADDPFFKPEQPATQSQTTTSWSHFVSLAAMSAVHSASFTTNVGLVTRTGSVAPIRSAISAANPVTREKMIGTETA